MGRTSSVRYGLKFQVIESCNKKSYWQLTVSTTKCSQLTHARSFTPWMFQITLVIWCVIVNSETNFASWVFLFHTREKKKTNFQGTKPKKRIQTFTLSFLTTLFQQAIIKILPLFQILFSSMAFINGILNHNETTIFELFWSIKVVFIKLTAGVIASKREVVFAAIIMKPKH